MDYLELLGNPYVFAALSEVVDNLGTCYNCKINGIEQEGNDSLMHEMKDKGIIKGCLYKLPSHVLFMVAHTGAAEGLDHLIGTDKSSINLTNTWSYSFGGLKYFYGATHLFLGTKSIINKGIEKLLK